MKTRVILTVSDPIHPYAPAGGIGGSHTARRHLLSEFADQFDEITINLDLAKRQPESELARIKDYGFIHIMGWFGRYLVEPLWDKFWSKIAHKLVHHNLDHMASEIHYAIDHEFVGVHTMNPLPPKDFDVSDNKFIGWHNSIEAMKRLSESKINHCIGYNFANLIKPVSWDKFINRSGVIWAARPVREKGLNVFGSAMRALHSIKVPIEVYANPRSINLDIYRLGVPLIVKKPFRSDSEREAALKGKRFGMAWMDFGVHKIPYYRFGTDPRYQAMPRLELFPLECLQAGVLPIFSENITPFSIRNSYPFQSTAPNLPKDIVKFHKEYNDKKLHEIYIDTVDRLNWSIHSERDEFERFLQI